MGILETGSTSENGTLGQGTIGGVKSPSPYGEDFPEGLIMVEVVNGEERTSDRIQLVGRFLPQIPFEYGGTQTLVKEYYPGNSEPTVQVIGSREKNIPIKGKFKTNKFKDVGLREAAIEYQELVDAMRLRGNLVKLTLGEFKRFGFIEGCDFKLNTRQEIEYNIDFFVVGFNPPTLDKNVRGDQSVTSPNKEIIAAAAQALINAQKFPPSMPTTFAEDINNAISAVAEKTNLLTNFVTDTIATGQDLVASANRAIGLIKNARATISKSVRDINFLAKDAVGLANSAKLESEKTLNTINNITHIHKINRDYSSLAALMASLQAKYAAFSTSVPMFRHLVREGNTLQSLAQKYYQNSELWKKIYDHNQLQSTTLVVGSVLEIPKL